MCAAGLRCGCGLWGLVSQSYFFLVTDRVRVMSFTGCNFQGKRSNVNGTSYACVVALALSQAIQQSDQPQQKLKWQTRLQELQKDTNEMPTNMIGGHFEDLVGNDDELRTFIEGLQKAESILQSFGDGIPNAFLRETIGQEGPGGYIQDIEYVPKPFLQTAGTLIRLLQTS